MAVGNPEKKAARRQRRNERIITSVEAAQRAHASNRARIRLSQKQHTGRKLSIHSTSYAVLFFLLMFTGVLTYIITQQAIATGQTIIENGSITVSGVVEGPPPTIAANITSPVNNQHFATNIINVSGTCEAGALVEVFRNGSSSGSQVCSGSSDFSINITIVPGENDLVARSSNGTGEYGPDSSTVTVFLDGTLTSGDNSTGGQQGGGEQDEASSEETGSIGLPFLIFTEPVQRGVWPKQKFQLPYEIDGGEAPYAISIDWGDNSHADTIPHSKAGNFKRSYVYAKPGQYTVKISGTDNNQDKAFVQTIVIVNGQTAAAPSSVFDLDSEGCENNNSVACLIIRNADAVWPVLIVTVIMTFSFWAGEQMVLRKYRHIIKNA